MGDKRLDRRKQPGMNKRRHRKHCQQENVDHRGGELYSSPSAASYQICLLFTYCGDQGKRLHKKATSACATLLQYLIRIFGALTAAPSVSTRISPKNNPRTPEDTQMASEDAKKNPEKTKKRRKRRGQQLVCERSAHGFIISARAAHTGQSTPMNPVATNEEPTNNNFVELTAEMVQAAIGNTDADHFNFVKETSGEDAAGMYRNHSSIEEGVGLSRANHDPLQHVDDLENKVAPALKDLALGAAAGEAQGLCKPTGLMQTSGVGSRLPCMTEHHEDVTLTVMKQEQSIDSRSSTESDGVFSETLSVATLSTLCTEEGFGGDTTEIQPYFRSSGQHLPPQVRLPYLPDTCEETAASMLWCDNQVGTQRIPGTGSKVSGTISTIAPSASTKYVRKDVKRTYAEVLARPLDTTYITKRTGNAKIIDMTAKTCNREPTGIATNVDIPHAKDSPKIPSSGSAILCKRTAVEVCEQGEQDAVEQLSNTSNNAVFEAFPITTTSLPSQPKISKTYIPWRDFPLRRYHIEPPTQTPLRHTNSDNYLELTFQAVSNSPTNDQGPGTDSIRPTGARHNLECDICTTSSALWHCFTCANVGCSRYASRHALTHYEQSGHRFAVDLDETSRIWSYELDQFVGEEECLRIVSRRNGKRKRRGEYF